MLFNYTYFNILNILLPISILINLLQLFKDYDEINYKIYKNILLLTVPFIIIFLFLISKNNINLNFIIGCLLIIISLENNFNLLKIILIKFPHFNWFFYIFIGAIHGLTNLGGPFLTAKVFITNVNKISKRATIAISYLTFASFQIFVLILMDFHFDLFYLIYTPLGLMTYIIINKLIFPKLSDYIYDTFISFFLLVLGILLVLKNFTW